MRPSKDEYFLTMARLVATRSTCLRRHVGCVLVNKLGHVLSTGYNGVATGMHHCNHLSKISQVSLDLENQYTYSCQGAKAASGTSLDKCQAIHAEQNALLQCRNVQEIATCYTTVSPCILCVKMLMNTSCTRIVFMEEYPHDECKELWVNSRPTLEHSMIARTWWQHPVPNLQFS